MSLKFQRCFLALLVSFLLTSLFVFYVQAQSPDAAVDVYQRPLAYKQPYSQTEDIQLLPPSDETAPQIFIQGNSGLFQPYTALSAAGSPDAVGIGDFNNDGLNDVAVSGSNLRVFLQKADGTLDNPVSYSTGGRPESLAVGDLNNDGWDDVVVANFSDDTIGVFLQQANGIMAAQVTYGTSTGPDAVAVADLNNDGWDDVVVSHWNAGNIGVFLQQPNGTLGSRISYAAPSAGYDDIDTGDLNDDGLNDAVKMNGQLYANPNLSVYLQNLNGNLDGPISYDLSGNILSNGVAAGDVTGDGLTDLVLSYGGNRPSSKVGVFAQTVTGTLELVATYNAYDIPEPVEIADVNRDGRLDVLTVHGGWNALGMFLQQSNGNLAPYELYGLPYASHYGPQGLDVGDINNDGLPDLVIADYNQGLVILYHAPFDFSLQASPASLTIQAGGVVSTNINLTPANGTLGQVDLTVEGLPLGATYQFSSAAVLVPDQVELSLELAPTVIPGVYPLTIIGRSGDLEHTIQVNLTVVEPLTSLVASNDSPTQLGQITTLMATVATGDNVTYSWNFGDGAFGAGANVTHIYPTIGTYIATVMASNNFENLTATTVVTITDIPITNLMSSSSSPTLLGEATQFNASANGSNAVYTWDFGDGTGATGANVNHTYVASGVYTVVVTASNSASSMSAATTVLVTEIPIPILYVTPTELSFSAVEGGANPPAASLTIDNVGDGALEWTLSEDAAWLNLSKTAGSGPDTVDVSVDVTGLKAGTYATQLTVSGADAHNSPQVVEITLIVDEPPPAQPIHLKANAGHSNIQLEWTPSSDPWVAAYRIWRAVSNLQTFEPLTTVDQTSYLDKDPTLTSGLNYCYKVEALGADESVVTVSNIACAIFGKTKLWVPEVWAAPGQIAFAPVNIRNADGLRIAASDIWLDFDATVIELLEVWSTPLTAGYTWSYSLATVEGQPGYNRARIAALSSNPPYLYGHGSLFWLKFRVLGNPNDETPLDLREFITGLGGSTIYTPADPFNPIPLTLEDGTLRVANTYILGDLNGNGVVEAVDAYIALRIAVGKLTPTTAQLHAGDINGNGQVDPADATMIFYYVIHNQWPLTPLNGNSLAAASSGTPVILSLDNVTGQPGDLVETMLRAQNLSNWAGGKFIIAYDPAVVDSIIEVTPVDLAGDFIVEFNNDEAGVLQIALADDIPVSGEGALLKISLRIAAAAVDGSSTLLTLAAAQLNDLSGRDFATSALQQTIERNSGQLQVGSVGNLPNPIYLPIVIK